MAVIPAGTRFEAIPTGTQINLRSTLVNDSDPSYTIEDLVSNIGTATQGPAGPAGATGATGANGLIGPMGPVGPTGLNWEGAWVSGNSYVEDDAVGYDGASWFCIADIPLGTVAPNLDTTHWALLASQGAVGPQGPAGVNGIPGANGNNGLQGPIGLNWEGAWVSGSSYGLTDAVSYNGSSYYCTAVSPIISNITPNVDTANWDLLAQKGANATSGGGLAGDSYVFVPGDKTTEALNGNDLIAKYAEAAALTPNGQPLGPNNKATLLIAPGTYYVGASFFAVNVNYVNVISLTGERDVFITTANATAALYVTGTANDILVKGIDLGVKRFTIDANLSSLVVENCKGGTRSFGATNNTVVSGTFINCEAGDESFGWGLNAQVSGTFKDCKAGGFSFGYPQSAVVSGTFTNCTATGSSFGSGASPLVSGTFKDCTSGDYSFGSGSIVTASGTFINCEAGGFSFGYGNNSVVSGTFTNCTATSESFGNGADITVSGEFTNCKAIATSFGSGVNAVITGKFNNCVAVGNSFGSGVNCDAGGEYNNCTSGDDSFGSGDATSKFTGVARNCVSTQNSFGGDDLMLQGLLLGCQLTVGNYRAVDPALGVIRLSIDATNAIIFEP